jgi:DNA-binding MarR family transcriptional regulator
MLNRRLAVFALIAIPAALSAQRGGGRRGTTPPDYDKLLSEDRGGNATIAKRDMDWINPVKAIVDKRKALTLTDEQLKSIKDVEAKLAASNDTLMKQLDSLRNEMKPNKQLSPQVEGMRMRGVRSSVVEVVKAIRANFDAAEPGILAVLTEDQQKTANELLDKLQEDADAMIQEKLGGRKRGG